MLSHFIFPLLKPNYGPQEFYTFQYFFAYFGEFLRSLTKPTISRSKLLRMQMEVLKNVNFVRCTSNSPFLCLNIIVLVNFSYGISLSLMSFHRSWWEFVKSGITKFGAHKYTTNHIGRLVNSSEFRISLWSTPRIPALYSNKVHLTPKMGLNWFFIMNIVIRGGWTIGKAILMRNW